MKRFKTMSELDVLNLAYEAIAVRWERECDRLEQNPGDYVAKILKERYWAKLDDLLSEIARLNREAEQN